MKGISTEVRLQLTDGYYLHFSQLSRMLQYGLENEDKDKISGSEYSEFLGQSPKNVEALRKILVELGLMVSNKLTLTDLGKVVANNDLFLENNSTLWICHYIISSNPENYVWYRFTNKVVQNVNNYSNEDFYNYYNDLDDINTGSSAQKRMHKEVKSILNAYTEQQFKNLRIIYKDYENKYQKDSPVEIDPLTFLYCLLLYKENKEITATALTIQEIINEDDTPSRVFHLEDYQVVDILEKLNSKQLISIERFGDLNQVRFPIDLTKEKVLREIYGSQT